MKIINALADWRLSAFSYLTAVLSFSLHMILLGLDDNSLHGVPPSAYAITLHCLLLLLLRVIVSPMKFGISWRAYLLGSVCNIGCHLLLYPGFWTFGVYLIALSFFHCSEFIIQAIYNPDSTSMDNYMLYHSTPYVVAAITSLIEYGVEAYLFPVLKVTGYVSNIGFCMVVLGEVLRKISMITAKSNFNHYVQYRKNTGHELVTSGVYGFFRHPAYVGWFMWSVGTQLLLCNPVCLIAYALASWYFFNERITEEEEALISFFGDKYLEYQDKVGTGIPFIHGYRPVRTMF